MSIAFCYLKLKLYRCDNGITVLHPQESEIVKRICESYLKGQSLLTIATWLNEEQIEYMPGVIGWNKARLKRIIEDERYLGKEPYPAILAEETYTAMQQIKDEPSIEVRQLNNDISRMLGAPQIDKDALRKKMMECISQKYKDLDEEAHTARKLQADFDRADTEDYKKTLNRTVSEIILYTDLTVGIILLNGQLIRRE